MVKQLQEGQRERLHEVMAANSNVLPVTATKASATQDSSEFAAFCRHSGLGVRMWRPCKSVLRNWSRSSRLVKNTSLMRRRHWNACPCDCWWTRSFAWPGGKCRHQSAVPSYKGSGMHGFPYFFNPIDIAHCCYCHCQWGRALHVTRKHSWILRARSLIWSLVLCPHLVASFKWCFLSFCEGRFQATVDVQIWGTL